MSKIENSKTSILKLFNKINSEIDNSISLITQKNAQAEAKQYLFTKVIALFEDILRIIDNMPTYIPEKTKEQKEDKIFLSERITYFHEKFFDSFRDDFMQTLNKRDHSSTLNDLNILKRKTNAFIETYKKVFSFKLKY